MALGEPVRVRLEERKQAAFEDEAARRGEPLGTYLRRRLEEGAEATMDLVELRRQLADLTREVSISRRQLADLSHDQKVAAPGPAAQPKAEAAVSNDELKAILLETLLILRTMAPPTDVRSAQSMMRRLKISHWSE